MKQIFLTIVTIFLICLTNSIFGQEIELKGIYASGNSKKYNTNIGYGFGYNQYIKSKNRLGISFTHYFSNTPYDDIYGSTEDGISTYIKEVEPDNQRIAIKLNYAFRLIDNAKSRLYFGPELSLNYFMVKEEYDRIANEFISGGSFTTSYQEINRLGIGFLFEFELKEIIHERISLHLSANPEITSFKKYGLMGGYDPYFIGWMNLNLGIRYLIND
jgi:hypothetical protein